MRKLVTIDCQYVHPHYAASYLLIDDGRAAFVEANTSLAVPILLEALHREGLQAAQVDYIIVTHAHLDHAGGCGTLASACPEAQVLAHPRAATHLIDPTRLVEGARQVYGDAELERLYGTITPIPAERVRAVQDGETLTWQGASWHFLHTLGHANHHMCIHDTALDAVFTGDSFGIAYPELQRQGLFVFPSTSPTNFQAAEAIETVDRLQALGVRRALLTHYGAIDDLDSAAQQLREELAHSRALLEVGARTELDEAALTRYFEGKLEERFAERLSALGLPFDQATQTLLKLDLQLNAAGIAHSSLRLRSRLARS
jgi:glyoxylase-like metal-dependent hydrolase (beta-lactamase superfamily II)